MFTQLTGIVCDKPGRVTEVMFVSLFLLNHAAKLGKGVKISNSLAESLTSLSTW